MYVYVRIHIFIYLSVYLFMYLSLIGLRGPYRAYRPSSVLALILRCKLNARMPRSPKQNNAASSSLGPGRTVRTVQSLQPSRRSFVGWPTEKLKHGSVVDCWYLCSFFRYNVVYDSPIFYCIRSHHHIQILYSVMILYYIFLYYITILLTTYYVMLVLYVILVYSRLYAIYNDVLAYLYTYRLLGMYKEMTFICTCHVCIYISHIHMYIHSYTGPNKKIYIYIYTTFLCVCIHICVCTYVHRYIHIYAYAHTCMHAYIHT